LVGSEEGVDRLEGFPVWNWATKRRSSRGRENRKPFEW